MADKPPDIAELAAAGKLGRTPEEGRNIVPMFPRKPPREPGDDSDLEQTERDRLRDRVIDHLRHGEDLEAYQAAQRLREQASPGELIPWIGWQDIMAPLEPIDWVIEGLEVAQGPPTMFAGYGYSGKTIASQSMIVSVAAGLPVWGSLHVEPGPVAHVDGEQGEWLTRERYQRLARAMGADLETLLRSGDMRLTCYPRARLADESEASWRRLFEGRRLVLLDSLRALLPAGVDENSSQVRAHLDMLARISEAEGCAVVILHHMRKAATDARGDVMRERVRGSSGLFDALQSLVAFSGERGDPPVLHHEKARITGNLREPFALEISDVPDPEGNGCRCGGCASCRWGVRVITADVRDLAAQRLAEEHAERLEAILAYLRANPDCSGRMIRQGVQGGNAPIAAALDELELKGRARNCGTPSRPRWRAV